MNTEWSLEEIYKGFDDEAYEADFKKLEDITAKFSAAVKADDKELLAKVEELLLLEEAITDTAGKLSLYIGLRQSVNTDDGAIMAQTNRLRKAVSAGSAAFSAASKLYAAIPDVDKFALESELVKKYSYKLKREKENAKHLLSDEVEEIISQLDMTGGSAWGNLQTYLTSTLKVDYDGRVVTLSEIRNLAYSADAGVRKEAYEAELKAYEKIADSVAFSLNNIKMQVNTLCEKRGYESALDMTLYESGMKKETLDAMLTAIKEYLPVFRKYLRKKGELLGHKNGLPWYDLFAPIGKADKSYSIDEAKEYLVNCFSGFTPEMASLMKEAFENSWIDFYPRKGKEGGAFCADANFIRQSRILTNYDGTFGAVDTLAHELGHAYHNRQLEDVAVLNQGAPMQLAETASTFNEVFLGKYALAQAGDEEKLSLIDSDLREQTQCIVDIYSRFLIESAVFEQSRNRFLMADDLKEIMLDAQRQSYGDGLEENAMHPYMWVCKGHYYSSGLSYYNFPYAFGNLFALGLYSLYKKEGGSFVPKYNKMLASTGCHSIEDVAATMGIDVTDVDFWRSSLQLIEAEVEEFCRL